MVRSLSHRTEDLRCVGAAARALGDSPASGRADLSPGSKVRSGRKDPQNVCREQRPFMNYNFSGRHGYVVF